MADISLITELDRLHHRATDMRARERQLADAGENDPASDAWKTAAILAASAESEFEIALVEAWPAVARLLREAEQWRARESETQEALQAIGEEFGVLGGEPRVDGIRRVLTEQRDQLAALLREAGGWRPIESAPRDRLVWAWRDGWHWGGEGKLAYVHSDYNGHKDVVTRGGRCGAPFRLGSKDAPTLFHLLPAPPAAGGKDGE